MINPYLNRTTTNRNIKRSEWGARVFATITTSAGAFIWATDLASRYLPAEWAASPWLAAAAGLVAAAAMGFLTDMMFGDLLQRVTTDVLMSYHPNVRKFNGAKYFTRMRRAESVLFGIVLVGLLAFDMYATFIIKDPIADQARAETTTDIAVATANVSASQIAASAPIERQIAGLKKTITAEEKRVVAANPALAKLAAEGNAWARQTIEKNKQRATAKMRTELEKATATYNQALEGQSKTLAATQTQITTENERITSANQRNRSVMAGMYILFTVAPKALAIILRILMVITFLAYSSNFNPDLTGDGIIDYADVEAFYERQKQEYNARVAAARQTVQPPPAGASFP